MDYVYHAAGPIARLTGWTPGRWRPTWRQLLASEPELAAVESAVAILGRPLRRAEWGCIRELVGRLLGPFGLNAMHPVLGELASHDAAIEYLSAVANERRWLPRLRRYRRWRGPTRSRRHV